MAMDILGAVSAYAKGGQVQKAGGIDMGGGASSGESFMDVMQQFAGDAIGDIKKAEQITKLGALGKTSPVELMTAVAQAEMTVQEMKTLREGVINAYQEITRMGI